MEVRTSDRLPWPTLRTLAHIAHVSQLVGGILSSYEGLVFSQTYLMTSDSQPLKPHPFENVRGAAVSIVDVLGLTPRLTERYRYPSFFFFVFLASSEVNDLICYTFIGI